MITPEVTMSDVSQGRQDFIERVYRHADREKERLMALEAETFAEEKVSPESVCAKIAAIERMP
jgi:hypothetical protein